MILQTLLPSSNRTRGRYDSQARSRAAGFSLVEVLISIVILSFGLLGMVGLQAAALQANRDARVQSVASNLARELAEMMRGNKDISLLTGSSNPYLGDFDNTTGTAPLAPTTTSYCLNVGATPCPAPPAPASPAPDVANAQMTDWLSRVDSELPGARVVVCSDSAPFDASGLPQWACSTGAGAPLVIKLGWTRGSTNRSKTNTQQFDRATIPSLVLPITPGNAA